MKRLSIITWTLLIPLFSLSADAGISVAVSAETTAIPYHNYTTDVTFRSSIAVFNDLPGYYYAIVTHRIYSALDDCFFTNSVDDFSFCCAFYGNSGVVTITHRGVGCPVDAHCEAFGYAGGATDYAYSACLSPCWEEGSGDPKSPILVSISDQRIELTDLAGGVRFDLDGDGSPEALSWTSADGDEAFLVLDRNGNNVIDDGSELFGDASPQPPGGVPNGYRALAVLDEPANGGNGDGYISAEDSVFSSLRLWLDSSHDGVSQGGELRTLSDQGIERIHLSYKEASRRDKHGNKFRFKGKAERMEGGVVPIWDVYFLRE